ncbi:MAG: acylphosphatase, partial [Nitrospirae bacterium]
AIAECYKGPPAAHVTKIDIKNQPYKGEFSGFEIRY